MRVAIFAGKGQGPQGGAKKIFCTQKKKKEKSGGCKKYFCTPPEIFLWGGGGGFDPPWGVFQTCPGGVEKKKIRAEKFPGGVARHAPTCALAMGPYSASCLVNKVTPCSQNATQLVKRRRKRKHAAWQKTKSSVPCACGARLQPTLPMT